MLLFLVSIMGRVDRCGEGGQHCTQYPTVPYTFLCTHIYLLCIYRLYFLLFLDKSYNPHPLCLVVYYMPPGFSPVVVSHGNSKSMEPYFPTLPSTSEDIKRKCAGCGPKEVISSIDSCVGGIVHASYPGELPRNEQQV